ncbi:MAG: hypothetical protein AB7Q81_01005 [Gammaproteobacteria bacterium]
MRLTTSWLDYPHFLLLGWSGLVFVALLLPIARLIYDFMVKRFHSNSVTVTVFPENR